MGGLLNSRPVPWTFRDCLWASIPAAVLFGWSAVRRMMGLPTALGMATGPVRMTIIFLATAAVWVVPVYLVAVRWRGARAVDLGFSRTPVARAAQRIGGAFLLLWAFNVVWGAIAHHFAIPLQPDMLKKFPAGWQGLALALVLGAVVAPISEEIFFRAFLFGALRKSYPFWIAAGCSALIFAAGHMVPGAIAPLYVLGLLFAWLRERTGSIWPSIVMHMLNNAIYFAAHFALANKIVS